MQTGYYSSAAGMVTQFNRLDTISNNLANVNTAGFKQDNVVIGDFMRLYKEARDELPIENQTKDGAKFINRTMARAPQIVDAYTDHSVGNMQKTDNTLDFALSKEGLFFAVKTPEGVRLTRDGSFTLDDEGTLRTKQGYEVLSESGGTIIFNTKDSVIAADKNGRLFINLPNSVNLTENSKLFIAHPDNLALMKKEGNNLFRYDGIENSESVDESGALLQGFEEKSNVNAVKMMTELIETNRLVEMYQKAMNTQMDDMNNDAIQKIAKRT